MNLSISRPCSIDDLTRSGVVSRALSDGEKAPDFELQSNSGQTVRSMLGGACRPQLLSGNVVSVLHARNAGPERER